MVHMRAWPIFGMLSACSLLIPIESDPGVLLGPPDASEDVTLVDRGAVPGSDSGAPDVMDITDAPSDRTVDAGTFCEQRPSAALCVDFDRGASEDQGMPFMQGGSLTLDDTTYASGPSSAKMVVGPATAPTYVHRVFALAKTSLRRAQFSYAVRLAANLDTNVNVELGGLDLGSSASASGGVYWKLESSSNELIAYTANRASAGATAVYSAESFGALPLNEWTVLEAEIDFVANTVTLKARGMTKTVGYFAASKKTDRFLYGPSAGRNPSASYVASTMNFDSIVLSLEP
jgi:hypothetical protein